CCARPRLRTAGRCSCSPSRWPSGNGHRRCATRPGRPSLPRRSAPVRRQPGWPGTRCGGAGEPDPGTQPPGSGTGLLGLATVIGGFVVATQFVQHLAEWAQRWNVSVVDRAAIQLLGPVELLPLYAGVGQNHPVRHVARDHSSAVGAVVLVRTRSGRLVRPRGPVSQGAGEQATGGAEPARGGRRGLDPPRDGHDQHDQQDDPARQYEPHEVSEPVPPVPHGFRSWPGLVTHANGTASGYARRAPTARERSPSAPDGDDNGTWAETATTSPSISPRHRRNRPVVTRRNLVCRPVGERRSSSAPRSWWVPPLERP